MHAHSCDLLVPRVNRTCAQVLEYVLECVLECFLQRFLQRVLELVLEVLVAGITDTYQVAVAQMCMWMNVVIDPLFYKQRPVFDTLPGF